MVKTSIVILTFNSQKYIKDLIESIYEFNKNQDFEIILVDNDSKDSTVKEAKTLNENLRKKNFKIIETGHNYGFAKGINIGAGEARGEYLLFINPDTKWNGGTIGDMIEVFDSYREVGVVGGKLLKANGEAELSCGKFFKPAAAAAVAFGLDEKLGVRFSPKIIKKVDFLSGGFMMVRRDLFSKLNGFDEALFMYMEDMELCFRARSAGYSTYFTPKASLVHDSHGSSNRSFAISNIHKGIFYFHKKHGTPFSFFLVKSLFLGKALGLVMAGKILNNKDLVDTYSSTLKL